ncbi:MAG TPA: (2Fe-2S)-binding protein [Clostridia bacterium]|nr:(2Fe-2S)-binding protein [Clostridia bacterium]
MFLEIKGKSIIELEVNGSIVSVAIRPADTLLYVLREQLGLTGTKHGCETGDCGACTVLIDGRPFKACLLLAVEAIGHAVTTIEGLVNTPIQNAFVEKFAVQCGYCTPGMIVNCHALINTFPNASDEIIEEWLESNVCRCTGYQEIREAIKAVQN